MFKLTAVEKIMLAMDFKESTPLESIVQLKMEQVEKMKDSIAEGDNHTEKSMEAEGNMVKEMEKMVIEKGTMVNEMRKADVMEENMVKELEKIQVIEEDIQEVKYSPEVAEIKETEYIKEMEDIVEKTIREHGGGTIHRGKDPVEMPQRQSVSSDGNKHMETHTPNRSYGWIRKGDSWTR